MELATAAPSAAVEAITADAAKWHETVYAIAKSVAQTNRHTGDQMMEEFNHCTALVEEACLTGGWTVMMMMTPVAEASALRHWRRQIAGLRVKADT